MSDLQVTQLSYFTCIDILQNFILFYFLIPGY